MKLEVSAPTLATALPAERSWFAVYADLFKARLTALVLLTTLLGFYVGYKGSIDYWLMMNAVLGMALVASGGAALNQLVERDFDKRMRRTADRPLPSGRLQPQTVLWVGWSCAILGVIYLAAAVNPLSAWLAAFTFATYLFVYTPLKRISWINTLVGAIPGAMPPLIGWTAATGNIGLGGLSLFAIQAFWQIPHFMAISWIYRDEYSRAGFKMLSGSDSEGRRTSRHALGHTLALLCVSALPWYMGFAGLTYFVAAIVLGLAFMALALRFARLLTVPRARELFYASILYLPLLLSAMVLDKVKG